MNALNADFVPVKAQGLSSLALLVRVFLQQGVTSTAEIARQTRKSERAIRKAKAEAEINIAGHPELEFRPTRNYSSAPGTYVPPPGTIVPPPGTIVPRDNQPHGENACQPPMTLGGRGALSSQQTIEQAAASSVHINTVHTDIRAREENPSLAGSPQSSAGSALKSPQNPTPSPKPTLASLTARLAPMLTSGETDEEKLEHAEEHVRNLLHSYDEQIINRALTRLTQRLIDGYKVQSFSRMLEALCGDVERDVAAKKPERPVPWGTIDLGDGRYVSEWA